jgi:hypothetical protein
MATIDDVLSQTGPTEFAIALSNLVFPRWDRDGYAGLTPAEAVAYCVDALEREVNNGGFRQFFDNSSGDTAVETAAALDAIHARQAAALVRRALAQFPQGAPPRDRDERSRLMDELPESAAERWMILDDEFYTYPDDLTTLMRRYVEAHRDEFRPW